MKKASTIQANIYNFTFVDWAPIAEQLCVPDISLSQDFLFLRFFHLPALPPMLPQPGLFDLLQSHWGSSSYSFEVSSDFTDLGMHTLPLSKPHQVLPTLREALFLSKGADFCSSWSLQMNCGPYIRLWVFIYFLVQGRHSYFNLP